MVLTEPATTFVPTEEKTKSKADLSFRWCFLGLLSSLSPWLCCSPCFLSKDTHLGSRSSTHGSYCTPRTNSCIGSNILQRHWTPGVCPCRAEHSGFPGRQTSAQTREHPPLAGGQDMSCQGLFPSPQTVTAGLKQIILQAFQFPPEKKKKKCPKRKLSGGSCFGLWVAWMIYCHLPGLYYKGTQGWMGPSDTAVWHSNKINMGN